MELFKKVRSHQILKIADEVHAYSGVPNKQAGSNKQAGRNFHEISIIEQVLINKQGGKIVEFQ